MDRKTTALTLAAALAGFVVLFDVSLNLQYSAGGEKRELDPGQEARYAACYGDRDKEIHAEAFGTIDNPDVQKLFISNNRAAAAAACRREFPERWLTTTEPMRFNVIDLHFRF